MRSACVGYVLLIYIFGNGNSRRIPIEERITNGVTVSIAEYPYQLSLLYNQSHFCGAVLIDKNKALTAAHCIVDRAERYTIRAGSSIVNSGGTIVDIKSIVSHPRYDSYRMDYDIAAITFDTPLTYSPTIKAIGLFRAFLFPGTRAIATGWGSTNSGDSELSKELRSVTVVTMSQYRCKLFYGFNVISDRMICAGYVLGGKDTCQGDSGGPLVSRGRLVGITSWGIDCGEAFHPGVYTRLSSVWPFIMKFKAGL